MGQQWPAAGVGALSAAVCAWEEVATIFIASNIVWPQVNNREGTQPHPSTENYVRDFLSMAPPIKQDPVFPLLSLSHQEASIILLHQRADRLKTTIAKN